MIISVVVQLYNLVRLLRNNVGLRDPKAQYIGRMNGVQTGTVEFALKIVLKAHPWFFVFALACVVALTNATLLWFVEKYSPLGLDTFEQVKELFSRVVDDLFLHVFYYHLLMTLFMCVCCFW